MDFDTVVSDRTVLNLQHKTKQVNKELWNEAVTYGDVQLMPFVDYYHLIALKTLAVCIHAVHPLVD